MILPKALYLHMGGLNSYLVRRNMLSSNQMTVEMVGVDNFHRQEF